MPISDICRHFIEPICNVCIRCRKTIHLQFTLLMHYTLSNHGIQLLFTLLVDKSLFGFQ